MSPTAMAAAQLTVAVEGSGSRITYAGAGGLSVGSVNPTVEWLTPSASVIADGGFAQFAGGGWSLQGTTAGSVFTPAVAELRGELAATAIGSTHQDGTGAGDMLGRGRLHWLGANRGVWTGVAFGQAWNGVQWQADRRGDAGAWLRQGMLTFVATAAPTWLGDSLRFLDADITMRLTQGPVEVAAFGGTRHWSQPTGAEGSRWGGGSAAFWFGSHVALVVAGGSYPADYAQGLPAGTYLSLGLRLASHRSGRNTPPASDARRSTAIAPPVPAVDPRLLAPVVPTFDIRPNDGGQVTFHLRAPTAGQVELMGDFTQWRPVALTQAQDGSWRVTLSVKPGVYRMNLRVDGGPWGVPAGLPAVADDFGGTVGVLKIEAP